MERKRCYYRMTELLGKNSQVKRFSVRLGFLFYIHMTLANNSVQRLTRAAKKQVEYRGIYHLGC